MPTVVQVELNPEYLKFPARCVCCARPDERNLEMAVGSTDPDERAEDVIMEVELPYCLECFAHAQAGSNIWRIIAVLVALSLVSLSSLQLGERFSGPIVL